MSLNREELLKLCKEIAEISYSQHEIAEVVDIQRFARQMFEIASEYEDFVIQQGRDPNLIIRAVKYLRDVHLIPRANESWFLNSFFVLMELACPNTGLSDDMNEFLFDVEEGIKEVRNIEYE